MRHNENELDKTRKNETEHERAGGKTRTNGRQNDKGQDKT